MPQPDGPEISEENKMAPYIVLPRHKPVPMALVAREPNGGMYFPWTLIAIRAS